jgi:hypothetical protein
VNVTEPAPRRAGFARAAAFLAAVALVGIAIVGPCARARHSGSRPDARRTGGSPAPSRRKGGGPPAWVEPHARPETPTAGESPADGAR